MALGRVRMAMVLVSVVMAGLGGSARAEPMATFRDDSRPVAAVPGWVRPVPVARFGWPLAPVPSVTRPFQPPSMPYGPGHRGADLAGVPDQPVLAPADGTIVYAAPLADRGVVAVDHADGLRTSYEPVTAAVRAGQRVSRGEPLGRLAPGHRACPAAACLHWGLRRDGEYLDPLLLVRALRVRLLPWSGPPR
ncbi:murein DD-endopeptidase MepM/ murein hydrolase activator NlpD [Pseudonocardia eucalypti]|uniref:murein hydrolase activator EnvC family protein n=1 Tax=Pseudonocardia eucalypti TaxID=648755 RepID=UPI0017CB4BF8|nr:murein DD-endopeptidase MepM/ murein hydrolase activator NlpD [Pseudonocardia eucalypti]